MSQVEKIMQTKAKFWQKHIVLKKVQQFMQMEEHSTYDQKFFVQRKVQKLMHIMKSKNSSMCGKLWAIYEKPTNS